ncbi:MAG TPA: molybdopterin molybdotransferase MoeA [Cyclobacteriaceae bacterium]|mgnify:CR=1 FL=1|nr:molybdopterin molybdotransferase MoeA [Cyclobacteriaceae bacterium]
MISVQEASAIILAHKLIFPVEELAISAVHEKVLAEAIQADRDFPPYNRVAMDGIAIQYQAYQSGQRTFQIAGVQRAGEAAKKINKANTCLEVMTGAVLPEGADTVIRYEDVSIADGSATVRIENVQAGSNVHEKGADKKAETVLMQAGTILSAAEIAVLASVGKSKVKVFASPKIAIVSTGDELVEIEAQPLPHQIRRSNSYALQAALKNLQIDASLFHLADDEALMQKAFEDLIQNFDVLLISGGVSKGKFDFIPRVLEANGIVKHFHGVAQKPGKPFWFGTGKSKVVFALPGNPVSTYLCFHKYILPWIHACRGTKAQTQYAQLAADFQLKDSSLTYFLQVKVSNENGILKAYAVPGGGSGDHANLLEVDGFLELASGKASFSAGSSYPLLIFR